MVCLIIYIAALVFKYALGPLAVLIYINVLKRAWNYLVTETLQEWIYIRYYSKGDSKFANLYLRLCDKVKHNRAVLSGGKNKGVLPSVRVRKLGNRMMVATMIIATMWVMAFGLNQEYAMPA